jgi:hypothetical protein
MSVSLNFQRDFGLANRIFMFANAFAYAKNNNKKLVFLKDLYHRFTNHSSIDYTHIFFADIPFTENDQTFQKFSEQDYCKFIEIPNFDHNVILNGCFQSEKYFENYYDEIFKRFSCSDFIKEKLFQEFKYLNRACFIHVRRGDYTYLPKYDLKLFDRYYPEAIERFNKKHLDVFFYVLSNDPDWCSQQQIFQKFNFQIVYCNEVIGLWLMQCCKYGGICANSSYSWWGGWLNKMTNNNSEIIFPSRIMNDNKDYSDLISKKFTVIDV